MALTQKIAGKIIADALIILKNRGVIAYPTESFYALGVLATDEKAVERLYELKKRPPEKPLPIIVGDMDTLESITSGISSKAKELMKRFWPGPLTLIFEARDNIPGLLTGGTGKVAVRIPGESAALDLARALKLPITATSVNPSGKPPAEDPDAVIGYFGEEIDLVIDAGKAPGGRPSTIVDVTVTPPEILREGSVSLNLIENQLKA
ncbi:MAG TPA: threonylcarbamoyl-AMP synthase [Nitrospirae bacterium]|nr:threonylcarbamoyl-AMP synthase [bacterium BMS3Abin06]HDH12077.1 threonylcarbamoyl-AMP synthase [Nitrospirota bacterium]HDZ02236.1 threonylcarbamoyl-AMP synthase [Nitrospirota bacterium]